VIENDVDGSTAVHYSKVATRFGLRFMGQHVAVVLPRFAFGEVLGTHFQETMLLLIIMKSYVIYWMIVKDLW
jgi:hypothetical protein